MHFHAKNYTYRYIENVDWVVVGCLYSVNWNGLLDHWNGLLEHWNGLLEHWNGLLEYWNGLLAVSHMRTRWERRGLDRTVTWFCNYSDEILIQQYWHWASSKCQLTHSMSQGNAQHVIGSCHRWSAFPGTLWEGGQIMCSCQVCWW